MWDGIRHKETSQVTLVLPDGHGCVEQSVFGVQRLAAVRAHPLSARKSGQCDHSGPVAHYPP